MLAYLSRGSGIPASKWAIPHLTVYIGMIYAEQVISVIDVLTRVKFSRFLLKGAKYFSPYVVSYLTRQRHEKYRDASGYCMVLAFSLWSGINEGNFTKRSWRTYAWGTNMLILGSSLRGVLHSVSLQSDESWIVCMGFTMNLSRWYWFILPFYMNSTLTLPFGKMPENL